MDDHWSEFARVALAHALAVASPGPDFALVLKQSLTRGRRIAVWTSIGIGTGIFLHISYSLLGLGLLIRSSEIWFVTAKLLGAGYLAWLGVQSLRTNRRDAVDGMNAPPSGGLGSTAATGAFTLGFLTNALNPKATMFFISLFVVVISPTTPKIVQAAYGGWMVIATMAWFTFVATIFTREEVRLKFVHHGHWIDRVLGIVFIGFALSLAAAIFK